MWDDDQSADILQKVHPIGPNLATGFAGSVQLAFRATSLLARVTAEHADSNRAPFLSRARGGLQQIFENAEQNEPDLAKLGLEVFIAGVIPGKGDGLAALTLSSPTGFEPVQIPNGEWGTIGSGIEHQDSQLFVRRPWNHFAGDLMHGEMFQPAGYAVTLAESVADSLYRQPIRSVSDLLQIATIRATGVTLRGLSATYDYGTEAQTARTTPHDLCTSYDSLRHWADAHAVTAVAARATTST